MTVVANERDEQQVHGDRALVQGRPSVDMFTQVHAPYIRAMSLCALLNVARGVDLD